MAKKRSTLIVDNKLATAVGLWARVLQEGASCSKTVSNGHFLTVAPTVEEDPPVLTEESMAAEDCPFPERVGVLGVGDPMTTGVIKTSSSGRPHCIDAGWLRALPSDWLGMAESSPKCSWPAGFNGAMGRGGGKKVRS
jgi:hypothetical protein